MSKQVVLLRVGIDAGCGGIQGPLFEDGSFDFVCIPDNKRVSVHTHGNMVGRGGKPLVGYFTDADGIPLVIQTGPANQRDDGKLEDLIEAWPVLTDGQTGEV